MNKKTIITVVTILVIFILIGGCVGYLLANNSKTHINIFSELKKDKVKITNNEAKNIKYEKFDNGKISMDIPKGWKLTVHPDGDNIHYTFKVENPKDSNYQIFFNMKLEGSLASEKERKWYASMYPNSPFAKSPVIDPQTTEQFYKTFNAIGKLNNTKGFTFPTMNNFTKIESLGKNVTGGEIIRGSYIDKNDKLIDGIFTVTIKPVSMYYVTMLYSYNTIFFTVPDGELTNWESVLNHCVGTISFSDKFINDFNKQEQIIASTSSNISKIANETSNIITSGWNNRQSTYDIISQKQSDVTLGYERVYNTETGDIYKAEIGFTDHDWNGLYKPVTDDMYNLPTSGFIEKIE